MPKGQVGQGGGVLWVITGIQDNVQYEQENCAHEQSGKEKTHLSPSGGSFYFVSALGNK